MTHAVTTTTLNGQMVAPDSLESEPVYFRLTATAWLKIAIVSGLKDLGMAITLFGVVALLCGWRVMRLAWFPIVFLICAFPWPELVYSYIASPLQRLAASVAVGTLRFTGVTAMNAGTKIIIVGR